MQLDPAALDALKNRQRQLDIDGCEVGVSRQALDELIAAYEALSRTGAVKVLPDDDNELAQMVEDFHQGSVAFANEPDEFHHLIELTPARLRKFIASLTAFEQAAPETRACTCHADDNPPDPCAQKYAYSECTAPESQQEPVAEFGNGEVLVDTGTFRGRPAVFVRPAPAPGPVGQLAPAGIRADGLREILPGEWFITFPTDEQACAVADALVGKFTRPSEQAVTEAMIDKVLDAAGDYMCKQYSDTTLHHPTDRARIKAAMEAGR